MPNENYVVKNILHKRNGRCLVLKSLKDGRKLKIRLSSLCDLPRLNEILTRNYNGNFKDNFGNDILVCDLYNERINLNLYLAIK